MQIDSFDEEIIIENIRQILSSDRGHPSYLYGTGDASSKILELIYSLDPPVQKTFFQRRVELVRPAAVFCGELKSRSLKMFF